MRPIEKLIDASKGASERGGTMGNSTAANAVQTKTPPYAWVCLIVSLLAAISIVYAWMWLPAVTFPVFKGWLGGNCASVMADPSQFGLLSNVMGFVPIAALIMAFPASFLVRKWGPKAGTLIGLVLAIVGSAITAITATTSFPAFLAGRFVLGMGLATTIVSGPTCVSVWFPNATRGRAMAIWSIWAPVGIFTVNLVGDGVYHMVGQSIANLMWAWTAIIVVIGVVFAIVFRLPHSDESSEVSAETKSFREVLPFFKKRQLWCLIFMFAIFNYMNYAFSQYLKTWLQLDVAAGGLGWDPALAGLVGGAITACGILAPLGGYILDKLPREKKYLAVVAGIAGLTICSALSFQTGVMFVFYVIFFCIGNMFLNGCCRPMIPSYVFKGGATAVALGLSFLTFGQYLGQTITSYALEPFNASMTAGACDPMLAVWALVPVGVIGVVFSLLMKPSKSEKAAFQTGEKPAAGASDKANH